MLPTTTYRQGDIVLLHFPFTDLTSAKKRPAVVISPDPFNRLNQDLILAAVTSQLTEDESAIVIEKDDCLEGSLPKKSVIKITKLFTIHSSLIVKRTCRLKPAKTEELLKRIREIFS